MGIKLIREDYMDQQVATSILDESTGKKRWYIEGVFAEQEQKNRNGRVYPKRVMEREIKRYIKEKVNTGRAMGELNHPTYRQVDPERVCHRITEIRQEGNDYIGKSLITDSNKNGLGAVVAGLLEDGCKLGVSTRGTGSLAMHEGTGIVQSDYYLECVDVVADPSANKAFVNGILEGVEYIWDNGLLVEQKCERIREDLLNWKSTDGNFEDLAIKKMDEFFNSFGTAENEAMNRMNDFYRNLRNPHA